MGMECKLTKYTNPTNEYIFIDKSVHEASLSSGKTKSGAKELFRQSLKFLRNTFKMLPKIKTKKGSYSLTDDKSNKIISTNPAENYFKNADEFSNILIKNDKLEQKGPIFSRLDPQKTEYCDDAVMYKDSSNQRKNVKEEPTYSTLEQLQQTNENTQTEAITTRTTLTDDQIKELYATVDKTNKNLKSQNTMSQPATPSEELPPPVPEKNLALRIEIEQLKKKESLSKK